MFYSAFLSVDHPLVREICDTIQSYLHPSLLMNAGEDVGEELEGWIDNEIGMAEYLLRILHPDRSYEVLTVRELYFIQFIVDRGGSSEDEFFQLRERGPEAIRDWFLSQEGFSAEWLL